MRTAVSRAGGGRVPLNRGPTVTTRTLPLWHSIHSIPNIEPLILIHSLDYILTEDILGGLVSEKKEHLSLVVRVLQDFLGNLEHWGNTWRRALVTFGLPLISGTVNSHIAKWQVSRDSIVPGHPFGITARSGGVCAHLQYKTDRNKLVSQTIAIVSPNIAHQYTTVNNQS
eukprot:sb/3472263/